MAWQYNYNDPWPVLHSHFGDIWDDNDYEWAELEPAVCFTRGTLIKTDQGERPIEELAAGDMVLTMDHGYQPIRWIGSSKRAATGDLAPILIRKGALGNDRDLRVSPQHRMLLQGWQAELLFGELEVLATAKSLLNDHSILRDEGGEVEYFHMLFDTHEIIYAEGCLLRASTRANRAGKPWIKPHGMRSSRSSHSLLTATSTTTAPPPA